MRKLFVLAVGVAIGFVAAHFVSRTPTGQRLFGQADQWIDAFSGEVATAYHKRESALRSH